MPSYSVVVPGTLPGKPTNGEPALSSTAPSSSSASMKRPAQDQHQRIAAGLSANAHLGSIYTRLRRPHRASAVLGRDDSGDAIILAILFASLWIVGESDLTVIRLNRPIITLVFLYPLLAVWVKRLHDRGRPGYMVIVFLVPWLLHQATNLAGDYR